MGFTEILTIIFILLKVFGVISWSWWLVLLPEIIALGLYLIIFGIGVTGVSWIHKPLRKSFKHFDDFDKFNF